MKRIAFITDIHLNEDFPKQSGVDPEKNLQTVLEDIRKREIKDIVFGGDIGDASAHPFFFNALKDFNLNLVIGNHDKYSEVKERYNKAREATGLYYTMEDENYTFLFLDSSLEEISNEQLEWLQNGVYTSKSLVLFIHHPILQIETRVDKLYPLKNREVLKGIFMNKEGEVTVFCGHYHLNDERKVANIRQITTQALSYQLKKHPDELVVDNTEFGYRILEFFEDSIQTEAINFRQIPS